MSAVPRVAFLRGINVGGARILRMETLRRLAAAAGLQEVATLGASGNLLYESRAAPQADAAVLAGALAKYVADPIVVVRDATRMRLVARANHFAKADANVPDKWRFVAFLKAPSRKVLPEAPAASGLEILGRTPGEVFYTMVEPTYVALAMAGRLERALGTRVTVRNWNVVREVANRLAGAGARPLRVGARASAPRRT